MKAKSILLYMGVCTAAAWSGAGAIHLYMATPPGPDTQLTTSSITAADIVEEAENSTAFESALDALADGDIEKSFAEMNTLPEAALEHRALAWALAMSGHADVPPEHIRETMRKMKDWPGQTLMMRNLERALTRGIFNGIQLSGLYPDGIPQTFQGAFALAQWKLSAGDKEKARNLITPYWHTDVLTASDEDLIAERFGDVLTARDNEIRFFNMMVRERISSGGRVARLAELGDLHDAWAAVIRQSPDADKLIAALGEKYKDTPGRLFMEVEHARRKGLIAGAAQMLETAKTDEEWQINPDAWWVERRIVARDIFEAGDAETAYALTSAHSGGSNTTRADAAFHAGWIALAGLRDAEKALPHFQQIEALSDGAISLGRAHYWQGRALQGKDAEGARQAFDKAAHYSTTFYGQLAAARLGPDGMVVNDPLPLPQDRTNLTSRETFRALGLFVKSGHTKQAVPIYYGLTDNAKTAGEIALLADHARERGFHDIALRIAKRADHNGLDVGGLTHPGGAIPESTILTAKDRALAHAIARQESEFNTGAVSRADARGLLQLMPGTARSMAKKVGLAYAPEKLTTDPAYNAALGTSYLDELLTRYDGSYVLTFAAYNAGPGRVKDWIRRFGDPRGKPLDEVIDWVEQIPFPETRSYVQRIIENLQVYKARFGIKADIARDLEVGRS